MDVDDTIMEQLRGLCTSDRDAMVRDFIQIVGEDRATADEAKFYLEMHSWTLANAIGAFYDNSSIPQQAIPTQFPEYLEEGSLSMSLVCETTAEEAVPPNVMFAKKFLVKNTGEKPWPVGCEIRFVDGSVMQQQDSYDVPSLGVGDEAEIIIPMVSPLDNGSYQSQWKLFTPFEWSFGDSLFCIVTVDSNVKNPNLYFDPMQINTQTIGQNFSFADPNWTRLRAGPARDASNDAPARPTTPNEQQDEMME